MLRNKWIQRLLLAGVILVSLYGTFRIMFSYYATPLIREEIENPIYTVGDPVYAKAIESGRGVVKFGPFMFGYYPGGVAFRTPEEAQLYLEEIRKENSGWGVYVLTGDFELDTYERSGKRYTNKSLLANQKYVPPFVAGKTGKSLTVQEFDQTQNKGWRSLADAGKYREAAESIVTYIHDHDDLNEMHLANLHFHAGQMYAFADDYETAKVHFRKAELDVDETEAPVKFRSYVRATIAFLEKDQQTLNECQEVIAAGPELNGTIPNLEIVRALKDNVGKPYSEVYGQFSGMNSSRE